MRRSDRLFDIIQRLRTARGPTTAAALADELEVTVRTVYRDVATLQARRVPIEGAPGIGYMLRRGFDLPPLMFTTEEIEAIAVGARLVARTGDPSLQDAAESVLSKVTVVLPEALRAQLATAPIFVSTFRRTGAGEHRSGRGAPGHPRRTQAAHRLRRRKRRTHAADDLADRGRLLRAGDVDRRMVRAAPGLSAFPCRSHQRR